MEYKKYIGRARNPITTYKSGLFVNSNFSWAGASPDGKVFDTKYGFGLLEVKCSYKMRDVAPLDACDDPSFFCEKNEGGLSTLKKNS